MAGVERERERERRRVGELSRTQKEEMENREKQEKETRRNARKNAQRKIQRQKRKKKKPEIDYTLRFVRHRETNDMGYIEGKSGKYWLVKWAPYKAPAVEHEIEEIHIEKALDELPDLCLSAKSSILKRKCVILRMGLGGK